MASRIILLNTEPNKSKYLRDKMFFRHYWLQMKQNLYSIGTFRALLHRNSTVARRVTNDTLEHYGNQQGYDGQDGTRGATYGLSGRCLLSWGSN